MNHRPSWLALWVGVLLAGAWAAAQSTPSPPPPVREVALTFDDLPVVEVGSGALAADLNDARATTWLLLNRLQDAPAIGFVNERKLQVPGEVDARTRLLEMWVTAGKELGNHTYSHADLQRMPPAQFEDEVPRGEVVTRRLMEARGLHLRYFRYPYTHTGPTRQVRDALESFLRERGYSLAPFTIENSDWIFNALYVRARRAQDEALRRRIRNAYLDYNDAMFDYFERAARQQFGRDIAQVLLIHANDLNAEALGEMQKRLKQRGYQFISLEKALSDPAYKTPDLYVGPYGPSWLHRWRLAKGQKMDMRDEPEPPAWVLEMHRQLQPTSD